MNILITVDPEIPVPPKLYGGIERIVEMLINGLVAKGHHVFLMANKDSTVNCSLIPFKGQSSFSKKDTLDNIFQIVQVVKQYQIDVIHSFSRLKYLSFLLRKNIPKIMSYQREPSLKGIKIASKLSKKETLHFTGCSNYIANQIKTVANATCIYNGAVSNLYSPNFECNEKGYLVFLGRIEEIKGTHIAIEIALKSNKDLIIAGNVPNDKVSKKYFEEKVAPFLQLPNIKYIGPVNDIEKNKLLRGAYAFLMPIQWNEPFGIVMAEALASGTPILAFPMGSVPEVVQNGINGFICNTTQDMIEKMTAINTLDREKVYHTFLQNFSDTVIVNAYENLYTKMVKKYQETKTKNNKK